MSLESPFKLLEVTIFSAQDLPPVSKMLRTFAVAFVNPDHKLTTKVDHHGHTNPTWNYKVAFHVDDKFLKNESSAVTIEIYNVAWLRDLPIGTTRLLISHLSPPLHKNASFRRVSLHICHSSGHLQGMMNVGVQLLDNSVPICEMNVPILRNVQQPNDQDPFQEHGYVKEEDWEKEEKDFRSGTTIISEKGNISPVFYEEPVKAHRPEPEPETKTVMTYTSYGSHFSAMTPLPSEIAADMKKGLYYTEWSEYGSSILENWTDPSVKSEDFGLMRSKSMRYGTDIRKSGSPGRVRSEKKKGMFSCFGNAYGFQFSLICGSKKKKTMMKKKKKRNVNPNNVHLMTLPQENMREFYV